VELQCGDAMNLPYPEEFFDAIFISFTLELFDTPSIPNVLNELRKVLKKNGRICVVAMSKEGKARIMLKIYEWGHERFPNYIDCRPIYIRKALENENFKITSDSTMSLLNVPVGIVLATK
jgi:demethylmenaquinone methyltransferase/2-methoxy-6-polyprenyl-1,4-benzoquinol methylase